MTPEQAVTILDQAASLAVLNRADHQRVVEAVNVLAQLVENSKPKEPDDATQPG